MKSLIIDTSSYELNIAIIKNSEIIVSHSEKNDNKLSERIFNIIENLFSTSRINIYDIDNIFVATGPGSFTGIRVGLTIAKVLAWTLKKPLIPISTLELLASTNTDKEYIVSIINDRDGFVYAGIYDNDLNNVFSDRYLMYVELLKETNNYENIEFVSFDEINKFVVKPVANLVKIIDKHKSDDVINVHHVNPNYIKKIEVEMKLEKNDKRNN